VAGYCEDGIEPSSSIKCGWFFDKLWNLEPRGGLSIKSHQSERESQSVSQLFSSLGIYIGIFSISEPSEGPGIKCLVLNREVTGLLLCRRLLFDGCGKLLYRWIKIIDKQDDYLCVCVCVCVCMYVCIYIYIFLYTRTLLQRHDRDWVFCVLITEYFSNRRV
jgi:hypothetical protein